MITERRYKQILKGLEERGVVQVKDLVKELQVSESTIRRDLQDLMNQGKLERVHGGAKKLPSLEEESFEEKSSQKLLEKKKVAKTAALLIQDGDTIFLDAGTATQAILPYLKDRRVHVVTNSLPHGVELCNSKVACSLIGGEVKNNTKAIVGPAALDQMKQFKFDKAFIGVNGLHPDYGFTTAEKREGQLKSLALSQAKEAYILADSSKFLKVYPVKFGNLNEAIVLTDPLTKEDSSLFQALTNILEAKE